MATKARASKQSGDGEHPLPPPLPAGAPFLMSRAQVAQALGVSERYVNQLVAAGRFPKPSTTTFGHPKWHPRLVQAAIDAECGVDRDGEDS